MKDHKLRELLGYQDDSEQLSFFSVIKELRKEIGKIKIAFNLQACDFCNGYCNAELLKTTDEKRLSLFGQMADKKICPDCAKKFHKIGESSCPMTRPGKKG